MAKSKLPLMPKATAAWLVDNTKLTFDQIGEFCGLHSLEVQAIADGEGSNNVTGLSPLLNGQLTSEEIARCEANPNARLKLQQDDLPTVQMRAKGPRYTAISKRADKPNGVAYLVKNHPELIDAQIARLLGTTKDTIAKVRDRTHWNTSQIKPQNPVLSGLCKQIDLDAALAKAARRRARAGVVEAMPVVDTSDSIIESDNFYQEHKTASQPTAESLFGNKSVPLDDDAAE